MKTAIHWFYLTHQAVSDDGGPYWLRTSLPSGGGVGDQDAWLMQALECLRHVHDALLHEAVARQRRNRAIEKWRNSRRKRNA